MDFSKKYVNPSPEGRANPISKLFFCWLFPLFKYGYSNCMQIKDLYNASKYDLSEHLGNSLERNWENEQKRAKAKKLKPQFRRAIMNTFMKSYALYGLELFFQSIIIKMTQPLVLAALIQYFDIPRTKPLYEGWCLAVGVILMVFVNVVIMHHATLGQQRIGMRLRVATCSLIYRKLLRLSKSSIANTAGGQVINLLSNDVARFDVASQFVNYIWLMPIQTIVAAGLMYNSIGVSAFAGILAILIQAVPLQGFLSHLQGKFRLKIANRTDYRVQLMNEITAGIQVLKMYAWEKPFENLVRIARKLEIDVITQTAYIQGFLVSLMVITEKFTLFLTVITYVFLGNKLTGEKVFSIAQFFNILQLYMAIYYPLGMSFFAESRISVKRIEEFLIQDEVPDPTPTEQSERDYFNKPKGVTIKNVNATWLSDSPTNTLSNISIQIKPGTLCAVVGAVGAGKSSLLQLLLKELPLKSGKLEINGNISYASQEPWLFVATVRHNILFGLPYIKSRYNEVVKVCALERDFQLFPYGDRTLVGERGVSLSGGQRARINLARAVYREADIYLFDDPLSAIDTHVGKHLFEQCILKYLRNKITILVTHQLQYLKQADIVVCLNNGHIENIGSYNDLATQKLIHLNEENAAEESKRNSIASIASKRMVSISSYSSEFEETEQEKIEESMEEGGIPLKLYVDYFRQGGNIILLLFFVLLLIIAQVVCNASDVWIRHWTNDEEQRDITEKIERFNGSMVQENRAIANYFITNADFTENITSMQEITNNYTHPAAIQDKLTTVFSNIIPEMLNQTSNDTFIENETMDDDLIDYESSLIYIYIYAGIIAGAILLTILRSLMFFKICMSASRELHNTMFNNVLKATMRFFDTNPSGRILNRFSKDMGAVDELLPRALMDAIGIFLILFGILVMVFIVTWWMVIPTIILAVLFYGIRKIYLASAQNIKRLEGIVRAPVFSHVSASLSGLTTIRSSGAQELIIKEFDALQDQHTAAWFLFLAASEAFGFYLDIISIIFLLIVTFQFLILDDGTTLSGDVGLGISQSLVLTGMLQFGMRQTAEVASQMTSVERIMQYTKLDKEGPFESPLDKKPRPGWPKTGKVVFKNLSLRYIPNEPPVLNNLNITIQTGEKVGIVGRTGAGKSTLIAALFRLAPTEGTITIDGVDTKEIGLHDLRSNISIIPQEPVLFSASVKYNLDPVNKSDDHTLWKALENVELKEAIPDLNQEVNEGGSNFSAGQRQLVCLARAIIRNNKVLVMDEATANVDPHTDSLIQTTIRKNFKHCTVLTIAHRLNTVMDSDKVLVMDAGRAIEFDHPYKLLQNPDGHFTSMVRETGAAMESKLRAIAEECYNNAPPNSENVVGK